MKHPRWFTAAVLLALLALSACGTGGAQQPDTQAADQFQSERGGQPGVPEPAERPVIGTVDHVNGSEVVVKEAEGGSVTVQIGSDTKIREQVTIRPGDLAVGTQVSVFGDRVDGEFTPRVVRVGDAGGVDAVLISGVPGAGPGIGPGGGPGAGPVLIRPGPDKVQLGKPESLSGTVESASDSSITIKDTEGKETTLSVSPELRVEQMQEAEAAAIVPGRSIITFGTLADNVFKATEVRLVPL